MKRDFSTLNERKIGGRWWAIDMDGECIGSVRAGQDMGIEGGFVATPDDGPARRFDTRTQATCWLVTLHCMVGYTIELASRIPAPREKGSDS